MMGHRQVEQAALFYEFSLERHIPADHLVRSIDRFVELEDLRRELAPFGATGPQPVKPVVSSRHPRRWLGRPRWARTGNWEDPALDIEGGVSYRWARAASESSTMNVNPRGGKRRR